MNLLPRWIPMACALSIITLPAAAEGPAVEVEEPAAKGDVAAQLQSPSVEQRKAALTSMAQQAPDPKHLPALIRALSDEDRDVRVAAGHLLIRFRDAAVPELIQQLQQDQDMPRQLALHVLQGMGPLAEPAVPVCIQLLDHEDLHTRYLACRVLGAIGPQALPARDRLIQAVKEDSTSVRHNAAEALGKIGPGIGQPGVQTLTAALEDFSRQIVRQKAAIALGELGDVAKSAQPTLEAGLKHPADRTQDVRRFRPLAAAAHTLWKLDPDSPLVLECLLCDLRENNEPWPAAVVLGEIGSELNALQPLEQMLQEPGWQQRENAALALAAMGPEARSAVPSLERLRDDPNPQVREAVADALRAITESSEDPDPAPSGDPLAPVDDSPAP